MCEPLFLCNKLFNLLSPYPSCLSFLTPPSFGHLPYMANATQRRSVEFYTIFNLFSFQDFRYMKFIHYQAEGED